MFVAADVEVLLLRIRRLPPTAKRKWGTMTLDGMFVHSRQALELYMGDFTLPSVRHWYTPIARLHALSRFNFPRDIKLPYDLPDSTNADLETERDRLIEAVKRYASLPIDYRIPEHPMLGKFKREEAGRFVYKHTDHHLRQFGG